MNKSLINTDASPFSKVNVYIPSPLRSSCGGRQALPGTTAEPILKNEMRSLLFSRLRIGFGFTRLLTEPSPEKALGGKVLL